MANTEPRTGNWLRRGIATSILIGTTAATAFGLTGCGNDKVSANPGETSAGTTPSASAPVTPGGAETPTPSPSQTSEAPKPPTEALRQWTNLNGLREVKDKWAEMTDEKRVEVVEVFLRDNYPDYKPEPVHSRTNAMIPEIVEKVVIGTKLDAATKLYLDPVLNKNGGEGRALADMVLDGICSPRGGAKAKIVDTLDYYQEFINEGMNNPLLINQLDIVVKSSQKWAPRIAPDNKSYSGIAFTWLQEDYSISKLPIPVGVAGSSVEVMADNYHRDVPARIMTFYPGVSETITFDREEGPVRVDTLPEIDKYDDYKQERDANRK